MYLLCRWIVEYGSSSKSALGHVTRWLRSEILSELWRRRVIYDILGLSIVSIWSSPFPGQWMVTGPEVDILVSVYIYIYICVCVCIPACLVEV